MSTILIGVDASARSEDAVAFGRRLATASGARVVVACAFPYEDVPNPATNSMYRDELRSGAELTAKRQAEGLRDVPEDRVEIRAVGRYSAAHVLHTIAGAEQASLVVVGSTHTGHLGRVMPGATAERLLHGSPCAVAVVPSGYRTQTDVPLRRIGVATDGSAESQAAVAAAAELACAAGARLDVISVVPSESYTAPALTGGPGYHTLRQDLEDRTRETLDDAMAALPAGTDADRVTLKGHPVHALIDHSTELDLLIVGSRGYGPLRSVIVGGVSGPVVRGAHCPVIALPRGVEAPLGELFTSSTTTAA